MELELIRTYFPNGTNGALYNKGKRICFSIELPWLDNKQKISCIPEGRYELMKRCNEHFGWHLRLMNVVNRSLILIHPANDALKELEGCIAPVSILTAEGKGRESRKAMEQIRQLTFPIFEKKEKVFLTIRSVPYELN